MIDPSEYSASKVKYKDGILLKVGTGFKDREKELKTFQQRYSIELPQDFLGYIGDYCEVGFDGFYRVAKRYEGEILWCHLLLMRIPTVIDKDLSQDYLATELIQQNKFLFYTSDGKLRYFPFGDALFEKGEESTKGFLVFDISEAYSICYVSPEDRRREPIANNVKEMINNSEFLHFG